MGSIYVICSRQCPNGDGIYTLLNALYKYSTSITNQPTNQGPLWIHIIYFCLGRGLEITGKTLFFLFPTVNIV